MSDKKLTDNEIIKALECHISISGNSFQNGKGCWSYKKTAFLEKGKIMEEL